MNPQGVPAQVHPEAHEAVKAAFSGPTPPQPHFNTVTVTPEMWQQLLATFGPMLVSLFQAIITRIGGQTQPTPTP